MTKKSRAGEDGAGAAPYRRGSRRVPVRAGLSDWRSWPWKTITLGSLSFLFAVTALWGFDRYLRDSDRFRVPNGAVTIGVTGLKRLDESVVKSVFAEDFGKSLFDVPLEARRRQLVETPWIRRAVVSRILPDRIWVDVVERRPIAFVRVQADKRGRQGTRLIDSEGVFLQPLEGVRFSFPVLDGIEPSMPFEERRPRVGLYQALISDLDSAEPRYSEAVSQVDVSDKENAKVTTIHDGDVIVLYMGDKLFRHRYEIFLKYVRGWKRQFGALGRVDLRYEEQVVVRPLRGGREVSD